MKRPAIIVLFVVILNGTFLYGQQYQQLLDNEHTLRWFKTEHFLPSQVIDRSNFDDWRRRGSTSIGQRALARVNELIESYPGISLDKDIQKELTGMMRRDAANLGLSRLPDRESR